MNQENFDAQGEGVELEVQPISLQEVENEEDPFSKGRERIAAIGDFIEKTKEKAGSLASRVSDTFSRFWSRTKSAAGEGAAALLSADVLAKKGYDATAEKVIAVDQAVTEKVGAFGETVGYKAAEAADYVQSKAEQVKDTVMDAYDETLLWGKDKKDQFGEFVTTNYDQAVNFKNEKAEQIKEFAADKVDLAKDVAFFVKEKTSAGLDQAKAGIENRYNKVKSFGENAIMSAGMEAARIKNAYRDGMNALRMRRLQAEYDKVVANEFIASEKAEKLKQKKETLAQKLGLVQALEAA